MNLRQRLAYKIYRTIDPGLKRTTDVERSIHGRYISGMKALARYCEEGKEPIAVQTLEEFIGTSEPNQDCIDLAALFKKFGSDKSTKHNYHYLYELIMRGRRQTALSIFELGLGTTDISIPHNMGESGKPGASLRAWKEWAPMATIRGADIDRTILFQEDRIETYYIDQTDPKVMKEVGNLFAPRSFDLLVDDGLHSQEGNFNFMVFAMDLVRDDGTIVIEDVDEGDLCFWIVAARVLEIAFCYLVKTQFSYVVIARTKTPLPLN